jgi:biotin carboxylase
MPSSQPTALILGGGHADIPMILAAKKMGCTVITTGNQPETPGHHFADHYVRGDFSDKSAMLELATKHKVNYVIPSCNDFAAFSAAYIASELELPGHDSLETTELLHHKDKFRLFCAQQNIPSPQLARAFDSIPNAVEYIRHIGKKVIVKPVDLTGGKGVSVVNIGDDLIDKVARAFVISRAKRIVIEEFLEGTSHGFSALLVQGSVVFGFMDNEHYFHNPFMVGAASAPSVLDDSVHRELCRIIEQIASRLSLVDGLFHVQFKMTSNGPSIIEVCRRPPGDLYVNLVSLVCGFDYPDSIVRGYLGMHIATPTARLRPVPLVRYCVMDEKVGLLKNVTYSRELNTRIVDQMPLWKTGQVVSDSLTTKYAILFVELDSNIDVVRQVDQISQHYNIQMESGL